jgi:hypothetical protein
MINKSVTDKLVAWGATNYAYLQFFVASQSSHGSVSLGTNGTFTYTPDQSYAGRGHFKYQYIRLTYESVIYDS